MITSHGFMTVTFRFIHRTTSCTSFLFNSLCRPRFCATTLEQRKYGRGSIPNDRPIIRHLTAQQPILTHVSAPISSSGQRHLDVEIDHRVHHQSYQRAARNDSEHLNTTSSNARKQRIFQRRNYLYFRFFIRLHIDATAC